MESNILLNLSIGCITCLYDSFVQDCPAIILVSQILSCLSFISLSVEVVYLVVWDLLEPVQVPPPEGEQLLGAEPEPGGDAGTPGLQIPQKLLELNQTMRTLYYRIIMTNHRPSLQSVDQSTDLEVVSAHPLRILHLLRAGGETELFTPPQHEDVVQLVLPPPAAALSLVQDPDIMNTE